MKKNTTTTKLSRIVFITLLSIVFYIGCYADPNTYRITYKITCNKKINLIIEYDNRSVDEDNEVIFFYGSEWQTEFSISLYGGYNDFKPYIYVKNNTGEDASITVEIIVNDKLDKSETITGPYAEIGIKGSALDAPAEEFGD